MKKIISLFQRNYDGYRLVVNEIVPGAEWVLDGEGKATEKLDGTCCMVRGGSLWKRYHCREEKRLPDGFGLEERVAQKDRHGKPVVKLYS